MYLQSWHGWCHKKLLPSRRVLCTPYNHIPCHFKQSHIRKVYACLAVTCHLRFWQNDRGLLLATAVIREIILYPVVIHRDAEDCSVSRSRRCLVTVRTTGLKKWLPVKICIVNCRLKNTLYVYTCLSGHPYVTISFLCLDIGSEDNGYL